METFTHLFQRLTLKNQPDQNLIREVTESSFKPHINAHDNVLHINAHKQTVEHALRKYLYPWQIDHVINGFKRSEITEESILTDFFNSDIPHHSIVRDCYYNTALEIAADTFRPDSKCRPAHLLDIEHHYPIKLQTNAEAPFSTSPTFLNMLPPDTKASTGNMKNIIFEFTRKWHHEIKDGTADFNKYLFFMLLHIKTTIIRNEDPNKLRTIWGVPKPWIYAQIMFHWALFAAYRRNPKRYPLLWGYETFTGGWFRLNHELFKSHLRSSFIMIDWKRFDKYVLHEGIDDIHDITGTYLDFDHGYLPTRDYPDTQSTWTPEKAARLKRLYSWTKYAYKNTPICLPDGSLYRRQFATLPSGLYTTQYYDSFYNYIMLATILLSLGFDPRQCIIKVLGDDSIIKLHVLIPPNMHDAFFEAMQTQATYYFGSIISVSKSKICNTLNGTEVLSYTNHNGLPHRDDDELLSKLYHTPSRSPTPPKTMASAIGIAYASCGHSRQVYNVCKDVYTYYANQGYTPDAAGLSHALGDDPFFGISIPINEFPSIHKIQSQLLSLNYVNETTYKRFYDRDWFLADF